MFLDTPSLLATRLTLPPVSSQLLCIIIHVSALTGEPTQFGQGFKPSSVKALKASLIACLITFPDDCEIAKRITFFNSEKFPVQLQDLSIRNATGDSVYSLEHADAIAHATFSKSDL